MRREPEEVSYLELATLPSAPFWARCQTKAALRAWQLWPDLIEIAELLVSELVTNAVKISGPTPQELAESGLASVERIALTLRLMPSRLVIEVFDNDINPPVLTDADADAESGRGLMLVQALSKEWGFFFPPAGGKTVFCVLSVPTVTTSYPAHSHLGRQAEHFALPHTTRIAPLPGGQK
ncbi:MAG TPA: ATP-binding protein [Streptosporangiaceae bacterium]|nr:ATP-binding protein [Streptosporangiaceae bacterium]